MGRGALTFSLVLLLAAACGDGSSSADDDDDVATIDGGGSGIDGGGSGIDGGGSGSCDGAAPVCVDHDTRRSCSAGVWSDEDCASGSGCVRGECVAAACSDECNLGATDGARTCELYDIGSGLWVSPDPAGSLADRSRAFEMWLRRDGVAFGGVGNAIYSDPPTYSNVTALGGLGDSAIWTGTYLAAEALRLEATGSADARANIAGIVDTLHLWFNVTGEPGLLARFVRPAGAGGVTEPNFDCLANPGHHCDVTYDGQQYDYLGHISRDQYQGVMLGYALAYEALGPEDETTRALIRDDVVEFVTELMKERTVSTKLVWNGTPLGPFDITMRFAVLAPDEMDGGAIEIIVDTGNPDASEMYGFQEFTPNLAHVVRQFPGLGFVPDIPRTGSAVMLSSFFQVALLVTDGAPGYETEHAAILDYYLNHSGEGGNVDDWLDIAKGWSSNPGCGDGYYANNIVMEPMYNLARLEADAGRSAIVLDQILNAKMWPAFVDTKNSFFSFIYAGVYAGADPGVAPAAEAQLAGFPPPPRVKIAVDLRADPTYMPHESGCTDQVDHSTAVDVADRVVSDFIWQRHPWGLYDGGNLAVTYPGVDYLVAYWLGRHHDFITDSAPERCLAWRAP